MTERMFILPSGEETEIDENNYVTADVVMNLADLMHNDLERTLDLFSMMVTDSELLMDLSYHPKSVTPEENIIFTVTGDVSMILEMEEANDDQED